MTDMPDWLQTAQKSSGGNRGPRRTPKLRTARPAASTQPASVSTGAVRRAATAQSHNTFRPDIFRVSEGYLN